MSTKQSTPRGGQGNGRSHRGVKIPDPSNATDPWKAALAAAVAYEEEIAERARKIRGQQRKLTPTLFVKLWPLLREPIHEAFLEHVGVVTGKPYESTGIKSVQVCIDRMDNVLTPLWWRDEVHYEKEGVGGRDGLIAHVTVHVGNPTEPPLISRSSAGGVDRGSTVGNIYKGTYTNAAKRAFAALGVGHEVYLGATDLDPDVNEEAAGQQSGAGQAPALKTIDAASVARLMEVFQQIPGDQDELKRDLKLKLGSIGVSGSSVGQAFAKLTPAQAAEVDGFLAELAEKASS